MKRLAKFFLYAIGALVLLVGGAVGLVALGFPKARDLSDRKFEPTPERVARGRYLAEHVLVCFDCHSERDRKQPGAPAIAALKGAGRDWTAEGNPWIVSPNITPDLETGLGKASDDAIARAIREGIGIDGRPLLPMMPYDIYKNLSDEDVASVVAYLRTIQPVKAQQARSTPPFPLNFMVRLMPQPIEKPVVAAATTPVERGKYLTTVAGCQFCHTGGSPPNLIPELELAGGHPFQMDGKVVHSANLTPDASGISYYNEQMFINVMRTGKVGARELSPVMPWAFYRGMSDDDLKAIYAYLKTVKPVKHNVDNTEAATLCKLDNVSHGGGAAN